MIDIDEFVDYEKEYLKYLDKRKVKMKKDSIQGCCPFHEDSNPSFNVDTKTGLYNCFGCSEQGNYITFISKIKGLNTKESYKYICEEHNVPFEDKEVTKNSVTTNFTVDFFRNLKCDILTKNK